MNSQMTNVSDLQGIKVPIEIQIKTKSMSIAQDAVHDSIYKNPNLPKPVRNDLSTALFPIFEKMAEIDRLTMQGKLDEVDKLEKDILEIKTQNAELFGKYDVEVKQAYQEYGKTIFKHKNEEHIEKESFLIGETGYQNSERNQMFNEMVNAVFSFYQQEGEQKEEDGIMYAISKMNTLDYKSFSILLNDLKKEMEYNTDEGIKPASLEDFEQIDELVTPQMRAQS